MITLVGVISFYLNLLPKTWLDESEIIVNTVLGSIFIFSLVKHQSFSPQRFAIFLTFSTLSVQIWLIQTISQYTNFGKIFSLALFCLYGVLNFLVFFVLAQANKVVFRHLNYLSLPLLWAAWEMLPLQLFKWKLVYLFSSESYVPCSVGTVGSTFISFTLLLIITFFKEKLYHRGIISLIVLITLECHVAPNFEKNIVKEKQLLLVQPNHSLEDKHNPEKIITLLEDINQLIDANSEKVDLIVLPESVFQYFIDRDLRNIRQDAFLSNIRLSTSLIFGALTSHHGQAFNSVLFIDPYGNVRGIYDKVILMPFGEYIPLRGILKFIDKFHPIEDFSSGKNPENIVLEGLSFLPLVCYEDLFDNYVLASSDKADVLLVVSNDLWFGRYLAPYLHDRFAAFRSKETGRILIRVSNSGYTTVYYPTHLKPFRLPPNKKLADVAKMKVIKVSTFAIYLQPVFEFILLTSLGFIFCLITVKKLLK